MAATWALCATLPLGAQTTSYEVDLNDRADDLFKVTVHLEALTAEDEIFQFAATVPGTYQVMDIGRYVSDFRAFDADGRAFWTSGSWSSPAAGQACASSFSNSPKSTGRTGRSPRIASSRSSPR